ncbi:hypothetical protein VNI00_014182 [Paramarasmius palmivorus]|uniref:Uncharacterized protein n=1 Tax=Paramarasmius palmivorus TaxID=297713 RepID=A0AAW0BU56_9AGAR
MLSSPFRLVKPMTLSVGFIGIGEPLQAAPPIRQSYQPPLHLPFMPSIRSPLLLPCLSRVISTLRPHSSLVVLEFSAARMVSEDLIVYRKLVDSQLRVVYAHHTRDEESPYNRASRFLERRQRPPRPLNTHIVFIARPIPLQLSPPSQHT